MIVGKHFLTQYLSCNIFQSKWHNDHTKSIRHTDIIHSENAEVIQKSTCDKRYYTDEKSPNNCIHAKFHSNRDVNKAIKVLLSILFNHSRPTVYSSPFSWIISFSNWFFFCLIPDFSCFMILLCVFVFTRFSKLIVRQVLRLVLQVKQQCVMFAIRYGEKMATRYKTTMCNNKATADELPGYHVAAITNSASISGQNGGRRK